MTPTRIIFTFLLAVGLARAAERPPNIVFILADDLGITDIGAYATHFTGAKSEDLFYETPHLDKLVADGIAFSQSYANQLCSPTRAAILTGRIASRMGVTTATPNSKTYHNQGLETPEGYNPHDVLEHKDPIKGKRPWINATSNTALDPAIPIWPRVLASHDCAFLGKWHLGGHGAAERQPGAFGFQELAYFDAGGSPYFKWQAEWNRAKPHFPTMPGKYRIGQAGPPTKEKYLTDDLSARAVNFLKSRQTKDNPFVLYYCPFNVIVKHPDNGEPLSPHSAIRVGDHKLIWDWHGRLSLYDISKDPFEMNDLAKGMPEFTAKLHIQLKLWLKKNVAPRYWPQRDESVTFEAASNPFAFQDLR